MTNAAINLQLNVFLFENLKKEEEGSLLSKWGNDQEVEFDEIKIQIFQEIKLFLIMRSNFVVIFHEVEIPNNDSIS